MAIPSEPSTPETREKAQSKVRLLTRGAVLAATGLTALIGVFVAEEHPGSGSPPKEPGTSSSTSTGSTTGNSGSGSNSGSSGNSGSSSTSSNGSTVPTPTFSRPTVTSGGTSS